MYSSPILFRFFLAFVFTGPFFKLFAQSSIPDFRRVGMAEYFIAAGAYEQALPYLDSVTVNKVYTPLEHLSAARAYLKQGYPEKARSHVLEAASKGYSYAWFSAGSKNQELKTLCTEEEYQDVYVKSRDEKVDIELYAELRSMFDLDQYMRNRWIRSRMRDSVWLREFRKLDSLHAGRIKGIIETQGWIGHKHLLLEQYFTVLFLHISAETFDPETFEKYRKLLWTEVEKGHLSPGNYAMWVDRQRIFTFEQKGIYGAFWKMGPDGDELAEVESPEQIDSLRRSIGLLSLKMYIEQRRAQGKKLRFPDWYKAKE
ncbi:MAG: hypothetical protein IBJ09_02475 [Bacteroidia bacterium]|nr:hypothetical protein [Bacteroidia bacterium]